MAAFERCPGDALDVVRARDVGDDGGQLGPCPAQPRGGGFQGIGADVGQHDAHPAAGRGGGQREADPARAAGHDGNPS